MEKDHEPNAPRDVLRDGNIKASIWRNEGGKGPFYSVNLARVYRDDQGELRDSHSFAGGDLLRVSELARKTYDRTQELRREERAASRETRGDNQHRSGVPLFESGDRNQRKHDYPDDRSNSGPNRRGPQR